MAKAMFTMMSAAAMWAIAHRVPGMKTSHIKPPINMGSCAHGLPSGSCPSCSGGGGGGSLPSSKAPKWQMSWNECYSMGLFLKRLREQQQMDRQVSLKFSAQQLQTLSHNPHGLVQLLQNTAERVSSFFKDFNLPSIEKWGLQFIQFQQLRFPLLNQLGRFAAWLLQTKTWLHHVNLSAATTFSTVLTKAQEQLMVFWKQLEQGFIQKLKQPLKRFWQRRKTLTFQNPLSLLIEKWHFPF